MTHEMLLTGSAFIPKSTDPKFLDLEGDTFGRLTVLGYAGRKNRISRWWCLCMCGNTTLVRASHLRKRETNSCGCLRTESVRNRHITHGETSRRRKGITVEYTAYCTAKKRCNNPRDKGYSHYGGRGIEFRFASFEQFLKALGRKPMPQYSLDRIDTNGHYESGNVRWATPTQQCRNRTCTRMLTLHGITRSLPEWAERIGISYSTVKARLDVGKWCVECALTIPKRAREITGCRH